MKKKNIILAASAAALILSAAVDSAWAYFTTYAQAKGGYTVELGDETTVEEKFSAWTKHVTVAVSQDSEPVYIRARAFCGSEYSLTYSDSSGKWSPDSDGYYYYSDIVNGGGVTDELEIRIGNVPEDVEDGDSFNVAVIYETTSVRYREDGMPYADWSATLNTGTVEGGD